MDLGWEDATQEALPSPSALQSPQRLIHEHVRQFQAPSQPPFFRLISPLHFNPTIYCRSFSVSALRMSAPAAARGVQPTSTGPPSSPTAKATRPSSMRMSAVASAASRSASLSRFLIRSAASSLHFPFRHHFSFPRLATGPQSCQSTCSHSVLVTSRSKE